MKFEEVPVDYHTGQPEIQLPLYSKKLHKNLSMNFKLRYSTQGVKVDSRSGWIGTSWSLDGPAVISRTVRGYPDDINLEGKIGVFHNNDYWNYRNLTAADKDEFNWYAIGSSYKQYDTELDLYQFNLPNGSGRFVVVKEDDALVAKLLSKGTAYAINLAYDTSSYEISRFTIIDANGYKFTFDQRERTWTTFVTSKKLQGSGSTVNQDDYNFLSAWHLSTIHLYNGVELASFSYVSDNNLTYVTSRTRTTNTFKFYTNDIAAPFNDLVENSYNQSVLKPKEIVNQVGVTIHSWKLETAWFNDGTRLTFNHQDNHPETNGKILNSIELRSHSSEVIRTYSLQQSIVHGRLWLDKLSISADIENQDYIIKYIDKDVPEFDGLKDAWGYGLNQQSGLIRSITYPTGGSKGFEFEGHDYSYIGDQFVGEESAGQNEDNLEWDNTFFVLQGEYDLVEREGIIDQKSISFTHAQTIDILVDVEVPSWDEGDEGITGTDGTAELFDSVWLRLIDSDGEEVAYVRLNEDQFQWDVPKGDYTIVMDSPNPFVHTIEGIVSLSYRKISENEDGITYSLKGGGYRIKSISYYESGLHKPLRKKTYSYADPNQVDRSSGVVDGKLGQLENT
ncbi:MAG: hypothetical protein AAF519_18930, partial [Bacteroidota bacterium]